MACSKYASRRQTTHAARMSRLLLGPCTDILRDVLRQHIPERSFPTALQNRRVKGILLGSRNLQTSQRELLYPQIGTFSGSYEDFDISLLYLLLRNITNITPHSNGWGSPPDQTDRTVSSNIDRIRMIRNQIGAHCHRHDLSDAVFSTSWAKLKRSVVEIVRTTAILTNYEQFINDLASEPMDPHREDQWVKVLQKQIQDDAETYQDILKTVESIQEKIKGVSNVQDKQTQIQKNQGDVQSKYGVTLTDHEDQLNKQGEVQNEHLTILTEHENRLKKQGQVQTKQGSTLTQHKDCLTKQGEVQMTQGAILGEHEKRLNKLEEAQDQEANNILDNTQAVLQNHRSCKSYIRTEQIDTVIQKLHKQHIVILTGKPGDGKSTIARQVLWELSENGKYVPVIITIPEQWNKMINLFEKMIIYIEDIFGSINVDNSAVEKWGKMFESMMASASEGNVFVLICSRSTIIADVKKSCQTHFLRPEYVNDLAFNVITFKEKENMLLQYEKIHIHRTSELIGDSFRDYEKWYGKDAVYKLSEQERETINKAEPYYGFPQTCFLFFARKDFFQMGTMFFLRPNKNLFENIDKMRKSTDIRTKMQYCTLAYVFLEGNIHLQDIKEDIFQEICEISSLLKWTYVEVEDAVQDLEGIYLSPNNETHVFTFCHETIQEAVAASIGKLAPDIVIQKGSDEIIQELIRTEGYETRHGEVILTIRKKYYPLLADRLLIEDPSYFIYHPATDDREFTSVLFDVMNKLQSSILTIIEEVWYGLLDEDKPVFYREILTRYGPHHIKHKAKDEQDSDTSAEHRCLITCEDVKDRLDELLCYGHKQTVIVIIRYVISNCDFNYFLNSYNGTLCYVRGMSVLHCCVIQGWADVVDEILNVVTPTKSENKWSSLHFAAFFGRLELFKKFEKLSFNVLETTQEGYNVLQVVLLRVRHGIRTSYNFSYFSVDYYLSVYDTYDKKVSFRDISERETDFINFIQYVMTGYPSLIPNIDMPLDEYNNNIIHYLVIHDLGLIYNVLVKKKKDIIFHRNDTELPSTLHVAAYLGRVKFVENLWKAGVRAEVTDLSIAKSIESGQEYSGRTVKCKRMYKEHSFAYQWRDRQGTVVNNIKLKCIKYQTVQFGCAEDYIAISSICNADKSENITCGF